MINYAELVWTSFCSHSSCDTKKTKPTQNQVHCIILQSSCSRQLFLNLTFVKLSKNSDSFRLTLPYNNLPQNSLRVSLVRPQVQTYFWKKKYHQYLLCPGFCFFFCVVMLLLLVRWHSHKGSSKWKIKMILCIMCLCFTHKQGDLSHILLVCFWRK